MTVVKRYVLRLFISLKYITANVVDRNNGRIVVSASTVEHSIKGSLECGRSCNAKAAAVVGEVLARRLKVEGLDEGQGRGIHVNVNNEVEKKGFKNRTKIWAIVNALKDNGVKLILDGSDENTYQPMTEGRICTDCIESANTGVCIFVLYNEPLSSFELFYYLCFPYRSGLSGGEVC